AELDQILIDRRRCGLHDEHVRAADVLVDLERDFAIRKPMQPRGPGRKAQVLGNLARKRGMSRTGEELQRTVSHREPSDTTKKELVGAEGFEPSNTGSKVPRLTAWPRPIPFTPLAPRRRPPDLLMSFSNSGDP